MPNGTYNAFLKYTDGSIEKASNQIIFLPSASPDRIYVEAVSTRDINAPAQDRHIGQAHYIRISSLDT